MKKEVKFYYVYLITNLVLNKQYVGSRMCYKNNIEEDNYMGSSKYLHADYEIFGIENFTKQIINFDCVNKIDMLDCETKNILKYNTLAPIGYNKFLPNQRKGFHMGGCKPWNTGKKGTYHLPPETEEHKQKISKANKGKKRNGPTWNLGLTKKTNQSIKKMSDTKKQHKIWLGKNNPNFNGKITNKPEVKEKIRIATKLRMANPEYKIKCCKKGKIMPAGFGLKVSERTSGNKNPRYIKINDQIQKKIIDLYVNEKFGLAEISTKYDLSTYKIKRILIDNNVKIIKNQFKQRHYMISTPL